VPDERRIDPPLEVVGPVIEHLRFVDESSPLSAMFEELLSKSIDQNGHADVHPAFAMMISQLSRDEAWMLFRLRESSFEVVDHLDYDGTANTFSNRTIVKSDLPSVELYLSDKVDLSFAHLQSLGLVEWPVMRQDPVMANGRQTGLTRFSTMQLTDLGKLFVKAAVPQSGFERFAKTQT